MRANGRPTTAEASPGALMSGSGDLRCQFPRNPRRRYDRKSAEADARKLAAMWLAIPAEERTADRLIQEARASGLETRVDAVEETEGLKAERFAPWLALLRAPGRVFLVAEIETLHD